MHVCRRLRQCRYPSMHAMPQRNLECDWVGTWAHTAVVMVAAVIGAEATAVAPENERGSA